MIRKYQDLIHIIKAQETIYPHWDKLSRFVPSRWRKLYLLSDGTLGAFTAIARSKHIGSNEITIADSSVIFTHILETIKSENYTELIRIIRSLSEFEDSALIKIICKNIIKKSDMTLGIDAIILTGSALSESDFFNVAKQQIQRFKPSAIDRTQKIEQLIDTIQKLHNIFASCVEIKNARPKSFLRKETGIDEEDFIFFDPGVFAANYKDIFHNSIRKNSLYYNSYSFLMGLEDDLRVILKSGASFCILLRFNKRLITTIQKIKLISETYIDYISLDIYSNVEYNDIGCRVKRFYGKIEKRKTDYLVIHNKRNSGSKIVFTEKKLHYTAELIERITGHEL